MNGNEPIFGGSVFSFDPSFTNAKEPGGGLTKREWLAGMAMMGGLSVLANPRAKLADGVNWKETAEHAYKLADAMIAASELSKGG